MRSRARNSLVTNTLLLGAIYAGTTAQMGCSSSGASEPGNTAPGAANTSDSTGSVGMHLSLPGGEQISSVSFTVTGPNGASTTVTTGTVNVANSQSVSFQVGNIPAGSGYTVTLTGTSADGSVTCAGSSTPFSIASHATTSVSVALQCNAAAPDAGSLLVNGGTYNCGTVTSITAVPAEVNVGFSVGVSSSATGPDLGNLTYAWSAPSGTFDNPNAKNVNFTCTTPGTVNLTLTVSDGTVPEGGVCNTALNTSTVQVKCDSVPLQTDIQNIVFIYAENRSFDALFGRYPGAHGLNEVVDSMGNPTAGYVAQKDRDGTTVLAKLPQTWGGATASGNPTVVTQAQTDNMPNAPFSLETGFMLINGAPALTTTDVTRDMAHRFFENQMEINGGTNDMFAAWLDSGGITMGHFDYSHGALYALAQNAVVADNFFEAAFGGSFLNHQYLICGCAPTVPSSFLATNGPSINTLGTPNAKGVVQLATNTTSPASALTGPPSFKTGAITPLDYFGPGDGYRAVNTMQPPYEPSGNFPATGATDLRYANAAAATTLPPQTQTTIGDQLTAHGLGWAWYAGAWNAATTDGQQAAGSAHTVIYTPSTPRAAPDFQAHHHPFNYYAAFDPATHAADRAAHLKDYTDLQNDITAGTLPPVAFYKPTGQVNMHPGYANIDDADAHIAGVISALKASPQWGHMVVVVTFDEYGGQWDHVAPPKGDLIGPGSRIPAIIFSPFAKTGTVDHTQYDTSSVLRLIAHRFALPLLPGVAARDAALVANGGTPMGDLTNALILP